MALFMLALSVFVTAACVLHVIRPSHGGAVVCAVFGAHRPRVWVSDSLSSQRGHGEDWQMCLAHLPRGVQYSINGNDDGFSVAFKWLRLRAIAIGRRRDVLRDSTLRQYRAGSRPSPRPGSCVAAIGRSLR